MTIKATFPDGNVMLFGDSYKKWIDQLAEYCRRHSQPRPQVEKCEAKWISFGGLKWCAPELLQGELDAEGQGRNASEFASWKPLNKIERQMLENRIPRNDQGDGRRENGPTSPPTSSPFHPPSC